MRTGMIACLFFYAFASVAGHLEHISQELFYEITQHLPFEALNNWGFVNKTWRGWLFRYYVKSVSSPTPLGMNQVPQIYEIKWDTKNNIQDIVPGELPLGKSGIVVHQDDPAMEAIIPFAFEVVNGYAIRYNRDVGGPHLGNLIKEDGRYCYKNLLHLGPFARKFNIAFGKRSVLVHTYEGLFVLDPCSNKIMTRFSTHDSYCQIYYHSGAKTLWLIGRTNGQIETLHYPPGF